MKSPSRQSAILNLVCDDDTARRPRTVNSFSPIEVGAVCRVVESAVSRWEGGKRTSRGEPARQYAVFLEELLCGPLEMT